MCYYIVFIIPPYYKKIRYIPTGAQAKINDFVVKPVYDSEVYLSYNNNNSTNVNVHKHFAIKHLIL